MLCRPNGLINIEKSFEKSVIWLVFLCRPHGANLISVLSTGVTPPPMLCRPNGLINIEKSFEKSVIWMVFCVAHMGLIQKS